MNRSSVTAVVLHFRTPEKTLNCVESLWVGGIESVVLVDNSQDGGLSLKSMSAGFEGLSQRGLCIQLISPVRNLGFAAGVNLAIESVVRDEGARVLLINSDAVLNEKALRAMSEAIDLGMDLVAPLLEGEGAFDKRGEVFSYQRWLGLHVPTWFPGAIDFLSGACLLLSPRLISLHPIFDDEFFFYGEDVELSYRARKCGMRLCQLQDVAIKHLGSSSSNKGSLFYEYHTVRGHWLLARKLARAGAEKVVAVVAHAVVLSLRAVWRSFRKRNSKPLLALMMAAIDLITGRRRDLTPSVPGRSES